MLVNNCIFCKIIQGKINSKIIKELPNAIAMLDAFPLTKGHLLVISKLHYSKIQEMDKDSYKDVFDLVFELSKILEISLNVNASLIAIHNGREAGQAIPHTHVHIIPRSSKDNAGSVHHLFRNVPKVSEEEMNLIFKEIKKRIE